MTAALAPAWLDALRAAGAARFAVTGLPSQRQEAWKYTGLNRLKAMTFEPSPASVVATDQLKPACEYPEAHRLVFIDGRFSEALSAIDSLPDGVILDSLAGLIVSRPDCVEPLLGKSADSSRRPMVALNTSWIADGLVLIVPRGVNLDRRIEVTYLQSGSGAPVSHPRQVISLGDHGSAVLVERHPGGAEGGFANAVTEITLGNGAHLGHYVLHDETLQCLSVESVSVRVGRDASYRGFGLTTGGALVRRDIEVALTEPGGSAHIDGAYLVDGERHADTTILVDHQAPHCQSRQIQKGVIGGHGRAVFQGKILVRPDAQKTDGAQLSQTLLLSPEAEIDIKPELEIHADDVKCSHGATVGRLDPEALFFLRSRGIPEAQARALLIEGFIGGVLDEIADEAVRVAFAEVAANWLSGHSSPESTA